VRRLITIAAGALLLLALAPAVQPAYANPGCGANDRPETGIPGEVPFADQLTRRADQGYNCGLALVGYNSLRSRGGNANMAWSQHCAYIAGDKGVAVVDVSDPANPRLTRTLHGKGSDVSLESIAAVDAGSRHLLAAGRYGLLGYTGNPNKIPLDIYDTTNCANPKLITTYDWPSNIHGLTFTADGLRLFGTLPVQAIDVANPAKPKFLGNIETDLKAQGVNHMYYAHEATLNADATRLYLGGQIYGDEELMVLDIKGWPQKRATLIGRLNAKPGHSVSIATINHKRHLVNSDESVVGLTAKGCVPEGFTPMGGAAQPYLTDISNERAPRTVGQFRLPINEPTNCAQQIAGNNNSSVHYHNVDNPEDTTFAMFPMWNAGLRIVDVRNPAAPREVAYFNPGRFQFANPVDRFRTKDGFARLARLQNMQGLDQAWAHVRYLPESGQIWLATQSGGFWVLELEPQVRAALGLPAVATRYPNGRAPRPAFTQFRVGNLPVSAAAYYCPLSTVAS
jgi:hypothetical protein